MVIDTETNRKLREMGAGILADALVAEDEDLSDGLGFSRRLGLIVDDAHATFFRAKVQGLIRRASLRYPQAELRGLDLVEQRHLDRELISELGACSFIGSARNIVVQGFTGSGKTFLACAIARAACANQYRACYIRVPDLEEAWLVASDKPGGKEKFLRKYMSYQILVLDEWLLESPSQACRAMLLELIERRHDVSSTVFCTQYPKKDWHERLGGDVQAEAIMDRIIHRTIWIETGETNMREHAAGEGLSG